MHTIPTDWKMIVPNPTPATPNPKPPLTNPLILTKIVKMNKIHITATELKNKTADILSAIYYEKLSAVIVERHGKPIAKITPVVSFKTPPIANYLAYAGRWNSKEAASIKRHITKLKNTARLTKSI